MLELLLVLLIVSIVLFIRIILSPDIIGRYKITREGCLSYSGRSKIRERLEKRVSAGKIEKYLDIKDATLKTVDRVFGSSLWDYKAFNVCLLVALFYPLGFIILQWFFTGNGEIVGVNFMQEEMEVRERWLFLLTLVLWYVLIYFWHSGKAVTWLKKHWSFLKKHRKIGRVILNLVVYSGTLAGFVAVAGVVADAGVSAGAVAVAGAVAGAVAVAVAGAGADTIAVAGAVAVAVAVTSAGAGAVTVTIAVAGVVAGAVAGAVAVAGAGAGAGAVAVAVTSAVAGAGAVTIAGAGAVAGAVAYLILESILSQWIGGILISLLFIGGGLLLADFTSVSPEGFILIVLIGLYPVINAFFDFLSLQLTRLLLRKMKSNYKWPKLILIGLADIVAAIGILLVLISCTRWTFVLVDNLYFPGDTVFSYSHWKPLGPFYLPNASWLWGMTLTTLLMSFFHLAVVILSLFFLNVKKGKELNEEFTKAMQFDPPSGTKAFYLEFKGDKDDPLYRKIAGYLIISPLLRFLAIIFFMSFILVLILEPSALLQIPKYLISRLVDKL